jgi:hypothetical protein
MRGLAGRAQADALRAARRPPGPRGRAPDARCPGGGPWALASDCSTSWPQIWRPPTSAGPRLQSPRRARRVRRRQHRRAVELDRCIKPVYSALPLVVRYARRRPQGHLRPQGERERGIGGREDRGLRLADTLGGKGLPPSNRRPRRFRRRSAPPSTSPTSAATKVPSAMLHRRPADATMPLRSALARTGKPGPLDPSMPNALPTPFMAARLTFRDESVPVPIPRPPMLETRLLSGSLPPRPSWARPD